MIIALQEIARCLPSRDLHEHCAMKALPETVAASAATAANGRAVQKTKSTSSVSRTAVVFVSPASGRRLLFGLGSTALKFRAQDYRAFLVLIVLVLIEASISNTIECC